MPATLSGCVLVFNRRTAEAAKAAGVGFGKLAQPVRAAVTGTNVSPGLFEVLELLGRELTLARIKRAVG